MLHRTPSRRMNDPKYPPQPAPAWWKIATPIVLLMLLIGGILWLISPELPRTLAGFGIGFSAICLIIYLLLKPVSVTMERWERERLMVLVVARKGESICTFARAFPYRKLDTWILRSVYETLFERTMEVLPIRPGDRLSSTLRVDGEDLEGIADEIARRAGRSMEFVEANPYNERMDTVRDLVMFLHHQPPPKRED